MVAQTLKQISVEKMHVVRVSLGGGHLFRHAVVLHKTTRRVYPVDTGILARQPELEVIAHARGPPHSRFRRSVGRCRVLIALLQLELP